MNITFKAFLSALQLALVANGKAGEALKAFKPTYNKLGAEKQFECRMQVADIIASAHSCTARRSSYDGEATIAFDGEKKDKENARAQLRYYFPTIGDNRGKASNKVDAVKSLLTSYGKLSTAEKRRFLAAIQ
jgi:hypothetical protein